MRIPAAIAAAGVALALPGCADRGGQEPATEVAGDAHAVTVEARDHEFEPPEVEVPAGPVELTLDNTGEAAHNLVVPAVGLAVEAEGDEQATTTFVAEEPGTYEMVCQYHEALGMTGTLEVVE